MLVLILCAAALIQFLSGCNNQPQNRVVIYCSVDDVYARPLVAELEKQTGLKFDVLYDVEAAKTAGLANRIRAERRRPRADIFWSSALLQTLLLDREGLFQEYVPPNAHDIPPAFKERFGAWTGVGVRRRVIVYNSKVANPPQTLEALLQPRFKNQITISDPAFGTGSDAAAALYVRWGEKKTLDYFRALKKNGVRVVPGNGVVAERVAKGDLMAGLTDLDDHLAQVRETQRDKTRAISVAPYIEPLEINAIAIPGSVALIKGGPNAENAKKVIDALVSVEFEKRFVQAMPGVEPLRNNPDLKKYPDDAPRWAGAWDKVNEPLAKILLTQ